jgi:uncharacterized membrane protein YgcG
MDPLLILVIVVGGAIGIVPGGMYAYHLWTEIRAKRRAEKEKREKIEEQLQGILEKDPVARSEYGYPFPVGHTPDAEEIVRRHHQRMAVVDDEAWKQRLRDKHTPADISNRYQPTRVTPVRTTQPTPDDGDDLTDLAVGIGVGMVVSSIFHDDRSSSSTSTDESFTSGGGDFGGGGASGSWGDDR